jgi:hypothetical protein
VVDFFYSRLWFSAGVNSHDMVEPKSAELVLFRILKILYPCQNYKAMKSDLIFCAEAFEI